MLATAVRSRKARLAVMLSAGALSAGAAAAPVASAAPVVTGGLVNVTITNVANNNRVLNNNTVTIQVPINAAANICGVSVLSLTSGSSCTATVG